MSSAKRHLHLPFHILHLVGLGPSKTDALLARQACVCVPKYERTHIAALRPVSCFICKWMNSWNLRFSFEGSIFSVRQDSKHDSRMSAGKREDIC